MKELKRAVVQVNQVNSSGRGTGFNICEDGLIITNRHLVDEGGAVEVNFESGGRYFSSDYQVITEIDLAIIELDGSRLPTLELARGDIPQLGAEVLVIGNPLGFSGTANKGEIIGHKPISGFSYPILEIQAPIHPGE